MLGGGKGQWEFPYVSGYSRMFVSLIAVLRLVVRYSLLLDGDIGVRKNMNRLRFSRTWFRPLIQGRDVEWRFVSCPSWRGAEVGVDLS